MHSFSLNFQPHKCVHKEFLKYSMQVVKKLSFSEGDTPKNIGKVSGHTLLSVAPEHPALEVYHEALKENLCLTQSS